MLGSRYNDKKERLENRRQSFFLSATDPLNNNHASTNSILYHGNDNNNDGGTSASGDLTSRAGGLAMTISHNSTTCSTTGLRRHTMVAKTRSLDSGVLRLSNSHTKMSSDNNPHDDYGSTHREAPLLPGAVPLSGKTRARSLLVQPVVSRSSCADLTNLDEKPLLDVVDRIEDQVEAHAYEDLVPLEVKLALENRIFGWSHLTSNILGHISYTLGSFLIAYFALTQVHHLYYKHKHGDAHVHDDDIWFKALRIGISCVCAFNTFRTIRRRRHIWFRAAYGSKEYHKDSARRQTMVRETDQKTLLGRLMTRGNVIMQRRVQRRLSKAAKMFQKRQQRQQQRLKQEQEKLMQEQPTIPEKEVLPDADGTERDFLCSAQSMCYSPCDSFCGGDYDEVDETNKDNGNNSDSTPTTSDEEDTIEAYLNSPVDSLSQQQQEALQAFKAEPEFNQQHVFNQKRKRRRTFHTKPTTKMESIMHDQVLLPPIINMPYAHGGFFGAAPFMLANPHWISILRHLMPDVYVEISRRVAYAPASRLIHWAENNPVVAAYGVAHSLEFDSLGPAIGKPKTNGNSNGERRLRATPNLEWDVFLNPSLVGRVEAVLAERDRFLGSILPMEHYEFYETHKPLGLSLDSWLDSINEAALDSSDKEDAGAQIEFTESQRQILKYYADQLESTSQELVDKMLIAHGKLTHLIYEILGMAKRYNYSRVKRTRRTLGGGIYARQWMAVFAEALKLGLYDDNDTISDMTSDDGRDQSIKNVDSFRSTSLDVLAGAMCPDSSIAESIATLQSILRRRGDDTIDAENPVGLVLDIKSRYISKRVWACAVDTLRASGVRVVGLASFTVDEIRDISKFCSEPLMEVIFFHSAGDLQRACHDGRIRYGDKVFFNGGSLLWSGTQSVTTSAKLAIGFGYDPEHMKRTYKILSFGRTRKTFDSESTMNSTSPTHRTPTISASSSWMEGSTIELYKERFGLSIGLYSQEFAIDDKAAQLMVELVNENPHVYDLGLSWGGVNGITIKGIQPGRFTSTDGLWNQRYIGALWDSNLYPPPMMMSPSGTPPQSPKQEKQQ